MIIMKRSTIVRSSLTFPTVLLGLAMISGVYIYKNHARQYSPVVVKENDKEAGAAGMYQYFFNARKNVSTNSMDYAAMLKADQQVQNIRNSRSTAGAMGFKWNSMGPSNIGGRTRAILIDKNDPTGQTIFAGGVSGGLWKSVNGGATWDSINDNMSNINIGCITEDANNNIYVGTGEGYSLYYGGQAFSTAILGGGVFKSTDHGATFNLLPATKPSATNSMGATWAYTNRIAILPNNPAVIYAATSAGLEVSTDTGKTFVLAKNGSGIGLSSNTLDVEVSADGSILVACVNGTGYYCYPATSQTTFLPMHNSGYGAIPTAGSGRIEFGIAPSNPDYIYASIANSSGGLQGIYFTMSAVKSGNGGIWYEIGPGGSQSFNPFGEPGGSAPSQGTYDDAVGVFPNNPGKVLIAGVTLWSWTQASPGDSTGGWNSVTVYNGGLGSTNYVHPDMHNVTIDKNNPNIVFIGCDGGIYKSYDGAKTFQPENRDYDVTQFYAITFGPYMNANGEGMGGGTQDNGTPYMSGTQYYYQDAVDVGGGDGGQAVISSINPNAYYISSDANTLLRSAALSTLGYPSDAYTGLKGLGKGANLDSIYRLGTGCFVDPVALYENPYDTTTLDSLIWISDNSYSPGDVVYPTSPNGNVPFPYKINRSLVKGDTIKVQNRVVSKIATGFSATQGVWMMMQAIDFADPVIWMPIGGPDSKPNAFTGSDAVHCLAFSPDGDALFVGTESGQFFRFSNLDSIIDTSYTTGALFSVPINVKAPVVNPKCRVKSTSLSAALVGNAGNDILSIAVDPKNGNNVMVTVGNYGNNTHVYYSNNALSATPSFRSVQGNLPEMPVYGSVLDVINSPYPNGAVVATEHGIWSTTDITVANPSWSADNNNMANGIVCAVHQQTLPAWNCNNSGDLYIGTHGRGAWFDSTFFVPTGIKQIVASSLKINMNIYPNPMNAGGTIAFTLPANAGKVDITIYDIQGRVVKQIPVETKAPGAHTVSINSQEMPVGTYLATLTGDNFRQTTRFVVAR
jgi:hypothetical protein